MMIPMWLIIGFIFAVLMTKDDSQETWSSNGNIDSHEFDLVKEALHEDAMSCTRIDSFI